MRKNYPNAMIMIKQHHDHRRMKWHCFLMMVVAIIILGMALYVPMLSIFFFVMLPMLSTLNYLKGNITNYERLAKVEHVVEIDA